MVVSSHSCGWSGLSTVGVDVNDHHPVRAAERQHLGGVVSPENLTYEQLASRIETELGARPAISTLRAAVATRTRRRSSDLTAGMPAPLSQPGSGHRTVFDATAVEAWLRTHPRLQLRRLQQQLALVGHAERPAAVAAARRDGLSWQQIADACATADATSYTKQWAQQRYGRP